MEKGSFPWNMQNGRSSSKDLKVLMLNTVLFCTLLLPLYIISTEKLLRHNLALKRKTIFKIMYSPVENEKTVLNSS